MPKTNRNDPCPCNSGKKYKSCCGALDKAQTAMHSLDRVSPNQMKVLPPLTGAIIRHANPSSATYYNQGIALKAQGKLDAAIESYRKALSIKPDFIEAHCNMGSALQAQGKFDEAIASYQKALSINPYFINALHNLGSVLRAQGKLDAAIDICRRVISIKPDFVEAHNNLGTVFQAQGKLDEAIACYRKALLLRPDHTDAYSNLLYLLSFHSQCLPAQYLAEAQHYGSQVAAQAKPYTWWPAFPMSQAARNIQTLRVGLVSRDLKSHPVGYFIENILAHLNPARVKLVAYSMLLQEQEDELTSRIKPHFAAWNVIAGLGDEATAIKIHDDGIHILIDLSGHTSYNRLPVFAWKPAPVQASWLGYWATTGVSGIDYFLADPVSVPESHREHFSEMVWYLPDTRLCFTPPADGVGLKPALLPAIRNGYITFGSFQNLSKINDTVLSVWSEIFHVLPQARLRLQNKQMNSASEREHLQCRLSRFGITPERVTMEGSSPREEYLAAYADVDIILDTFPFSGGTTTCEALWMGVPTVTLAGDTLIARQGTSLLACAGFKDWIASDERDYVARVVNHATDIKRLEQLRTGMRQKVLASPLFDASRFALNLENALHGMWQQKILAATSGFEPDSKFKK